MTITVLNAVYASNNKGLDVTSLCQQLVASGHTVLAINNGSFTDPDPGYVKRFMIRYLCTGQNDDRPIDRACVEGSQLDLLQSAALPAFAAPQAELAPLPGAQFRILRAIYGTTQLGMDVTAYCQAQANQGMAALSLQVTNISFGIDPAPCMQKVLVIQYVTGGQTLQVGGVDYDTLTLHALPPVAGPALGSYTPGTPFQLGWSTDGTTLIAQVPVAGGHVIVSKQPLAPNNGRNTWLQKHANGRIYLLDVHGQPTRYCLEAALGGQFPGDGQFARGNGGLVILNDDIPQRQTQLWTITPADVAQPPGTVCYCVQNVGLSLTGGSSAEPYLLDSAGSTVPGSVCQVCKGGNNNPHQSWQLLEPMPA